MAGGYRLFDQICHVNKNILFKEILDAFILLLSYSDEGVILNYLWYVKHWKNKPGQKRNTDVFCV